MVDIKFVALVHGARLPEYARDGDSGMDLRWFEGAFSYLNLFAGETRILWTGLSMEVPEGYEAQVRPRSSFSAAGHIVPLGTIDAGYRGEIGVVMANTTRSSVCSLKRGDRVAQLVIAPVTRVNAVLVSVADYVDNVASRARGTGGFGSTGKE